VARVTLTGRLYDKRVDRKTGQPIAGKLTNMMQLTVEVDNSGHGYRNNAMLQVKEDWPGWCFGVDKVEEQNVS
jgi:hypothetical protein